MKAIRVHQFGEPDVLKLEEIPDPKPQAGQVLVRICAAGVNPVETYIRAGKYGPQNFPYTPGNDAAGTVEAIGSGVTHVKPGDRVYTDKTITGSYAELAVADASTVHLLPQHVTFQQGAAVGIACGTAWRGLFQRGAARAGETVLIHGATGGVGTAAVQLARAAGLTVFASAGSEKGRQYVLEQGAHHAVDHQITERPDEVKSMTGGKGFDLIIELASDKNLASDLTSLSQRGRVVVIGSRGKITIDPRDTMSRETDIRGLTLMGTTPEEHHSIYSALDAALENRTLRPVIGLELPLSEAAKAHQEVMEGQSHGKIVLIP